LERRLVNITFHGVGPQDGVLASGEATVWVTRSRFETVLDQLVERDDVRITFDDGNASDLELALPALRERGLTATFFVVAGRLGTPGYLDAGGLRELVAAGMRVGNHGMRHRSWRRLGAGELHEELVVARRMIEEAAGRQVTEAACPFGAYDRRVLRALRRSGYRHVFTSDEGTARASDWLQSRTSLDERRALHPILAPALSPTAALRRQAKLAVKRWRWAPPTASSATPRVHSAARI
jgi:peptidoglycan/xylan/chitin deacetylase (PgdA/CDA1 family)